MNKHNDLKECIPYFTLRFPTMSTKIRYVKEYNCRAALAQPCLGVRPPRRARGKKTPIIPFKNKHKPTCQLNKTKTQAIYVRFQTLTSLLIQNQIIVIFEMTAQNRFWKWPTHSNLSFYCQYILFITHWLVKNIRRILGP